MFTEDLTEQVKVLSDRDCKTRCELVSKVAKLPVDFLNAASLLRSSCAARTARVGSFVVQPPRAVLIPPDLSLDDAPARAPSAAGVPGDCPQWEAQP